MTIKVDGLFLERPPSRGFLLDLRGWGLLVALVPATIMLLRGGLPSPAARFGLLHLAVLILVLLGLERSLDRAGLQIEPWSRSARYEALGEGLLTLVRRWLQGCLVGAWVVALTASSAHGACLLIALLGLLSLGSSLGEAPLRSLLGAGLGGAAGWLLGGPSAAFAALAPGWFLGRWTDPSIPSGVSLRVLALLLPWCGLLGCPLDPRDLSPAATYQLMLALGLVGWLLAGAVRGGEPRLRSSFSKLTAWDEAQALLRAGQPVRAAQRLESLLASQGAAVDTRVLQTLAAAYRLSDCWLRAEEIYRAWLERQSGDPDASAGLAETLWWLGRYAQAEEVARQAETHPLALAVLASLQYEREPAAALDLAEQALARGVTAHGLEARAYSLQALGRTVDARRALEDLIAWLGAQRQRETRSEERRARAERALAELSS